MHPRRGAADQKSIQNLCKIDAGKRHATSMENDAKMEAKWRPKSLENLKICEQMHAKIQCWILMLIFGLWWRFWIDFWSGLGGLGGSWIQAKTSGWLQLGFHTPCTPGGVRRMKIDAKIWCWKKGKSFLRLAIFDWILERFGGFGG